MATLTCTDVQRRFLDAPDQYGKTEKLFISLDVVMDDGAIGKLDPRLNPSWSKKANLYKYAVAFGCVTDLGSPFDAAMLKGKSARGMIRTDFEISEWPQVVVDTLVPIKGKAKAKDQSAPVAAQEGTQPPSGAAVDEDTISAWWIARLGEGFQRKAIIDLCAAMFEARVPGALNAEELAGLTDEMNRQA